jgi:hypothetical protein
MSGGVGRPGIGIGIGIGIPWVWVWLLKRRVGESTLGTSTEVGVFVYSQAIIIYDCCLG